MSRGFGEGPGGGGWGGGGDFSSLAKILGECSTIHSSPAIFVSVFVVVKVEIS